MTDLCPRGGAPLVVSLTLLGQVIGRICLERADSTFEHCKLPLLWHKRNILFFPKTTKLLPLPRYNLFPASVSLIFSQLPIVGT